MKRFAYGLDPLCLAGCAAYALNRWGLKPWVDSAFLHSHFNDMWLIPCALPWVLWIQRRLGLRTHDRPPTFAEISGHWLGWSMLFEWIGPHLLAVTGDWWDVVAYAIGALGGWLWWCCTHEAARLRIDALRGWFARLGVSSG